MARKKETKSERLGIRISARQRFGLDLMARKYRISEAEAVARCIEAALDKEGFTPLKEGGLFSVFDYLYDGSPAVRLLKIAEFADMATPDEVRIFKAFEMLRERYEKIVGEAPFFHPKPINDELVALISAYLGFTADANLPAGDEEKYLRQCDETVMFAIPDIAKECGMSVDTFREKYVTA